MKWISVKDRLPEHDGFSSDQILLFHPFKKIDNTNSFAIFVGYWDHLNKEWTCSWSGMFPPCEDNYCQSFIEDNFSLTKKQVTHWMPLPEPPKE